jgi:hypothetical protein
MKDKPMDEDNKKDAEQFVQNLHGLISALQEATMKAAVLAKTALQERDLATMRTDGPALKVSEFGLQALDVAARASQQICALSAMALDVAKTLRVPAKSSTTLMEQKE